MGMLKVDANKKMLTYEEPYQGKLMIAMPNGAILKGTME